MAGKRSKEKGRRGEIEWAEWLTEAGWPAHRGRQYSGGPGTPDVKGGIPDTHCEVKRAENLRLYDAMDQAIGDAGDDVVPYVAHRRNNRPWLVVLLADDIVRFAQAVVAAENEGTPKVRYIE